MDIILNNGVLINIDCMQFMKKMDNNSVDITLTDIPYDGVNKSKECGLRKLNKGKADVKTFELDDFIKEIYRVTKNTIIIFCGNTQVSHIMSWMYDRQDVYNDKISIRQLIYRKTNPSPMNGQHMYLSAVENAIWVKKKGAPFNAYCKSNVFSFPCGKSKLHPTEKNHKLIEDLILDNSNENDILFDPCCGSGAHLLIAKELKRNFIGCEIDTEYYNIAKKRLKQ